LRERGASSYARGVRAFGTPPSADEIEVIARRALADIPNHFAQHILGVLLRVEEFADDDTLRDLRIDDAFDLTGVYEGLPIGEKSVDQAAVLPDRIRLFRRAILDEWASGEDSLEHLVAHVVIHELGHHFGLSDEAMHAIEASAG
jgi:predicted Zn-dependent protease with MMP-like domain